MKTDMHRIALLGRLDRLDATSPAERAELAAFWKRVEDEALRLLAKSLKHG